MHHVADDHSIDLTFEIFDDYDTMSSSSSAPASAPDSPRKLNIISTNFAAKLPPHQKQDPTLGLNSANRQLLHLQSVYSNSRNILDCIEDMINAENKYLLLELSQILLDIESSIPNNTFIINNILR